MCLELSLCRPGAQVPSQEEDLCDTLTGEHAGSGSRAASTLSDDDRPQCSSYTAHQTSGSEPSSAAAGLPFRTPWGTVGKWELLGPAAAAFQKGQAPASFVSGFGGQRQQDLSQETVG